MTALLLLFVGKTKEGFVRDGIRKYEDLVRHMAPVEVREIKGSSARDKKAAVEEEGRSILSRLAPSDRLVCLDERGRGLDSPALAGRLKGLMESGRRAVFAVGGPFGLSEEVKDRAEMVLSLSKLTLTHEMARVVLLEQIYRSLTIIKGKAYHY